MSHLTAEILGSIVVERKDYLYLSLTLVFPDLTENTFNGEVFLLSDCLFSSSFCIQSHFIFTSVVGVSCVKKILPSLMTQISQETSKVEHRQFC